jgi:hypothetical protein
MDILIIKGNIDWSLGSPALLVTAIFATAPPLYKG